MTRHIANIPDACQALCNPTGIFEPVENPSSDVFMRALLHVENILNICYEFWLDKQ
jgi:hypothetical protein